MHIRITRPVEVDISHLCGIEEGMLVDEIIPWEFKAGDIVKVEPDEEEDSLLPGSRGFFFWADAYGFIPDDAFEPVPELVQVSRLENIRTVAVQNEFGGER